MIDLSKYNLESLFRQLAGRQLGEYLSEYAFKDAADWAAQTPNIYPLGTLHLKGDDGGRGGGKTWATEDDSIWVSVDRDGTITRVQKAK